MADTPLKLETTCDADIAADSLLSSHPEGVNYNHLGYFIRLDAEGKLKDAVRIGEFTSVGYCWMLNILKDSQPIDDTIATLLDEWASIPKPEFCPDIPTDKMCELFKRGFHYLLNYDSNNTYQLDTKASVKHLFAHTGPLVLSTPLPPQPEVGQKRKTETRSDTPAHVHKKKNTHAVYRIALKL